MDRKSNLRTASIGPDAGSQQEFTSQAHQTASWKSKNETTQYTTGKPPQGGGKLGGQNTNS